MKLKTKDLLNALRNCSGVLRVRTTLPILSCVRLRCVGTMLEICATDLDAWITSMVAFEGEAIEPCCITATRIRLIMEAAQSETVDITYRDGKLSLKSGAAVQLSAQDAKEFLEEPNATSGVAVPALDLADAIEGVAWAASKDNLRKTIDCIEIALSAKRLEAFSFQGHVGAWFFRPIICGDEKLCVPAKQALLLIPALRGTEPVIQRNDNVLAAKSSEMAVTVKLSADKYAFPMMQIFDMLPKDMTDVDCEFLLRCCAQASAIATDTKRPLLSLERTGKELNVSCTEDFGEFEEGVEHKSPKTFTGIDGGYLGESVSKFGTKSVKLGIVEESSHHFLQHGDLTVAIMGRYLKKA